MEKIQELQSNLSQDMIVVDKEEQKLKVIKSLNRQPSQ
jgi:hypothetical protein